MDTGIAWTKEIESCFKEITLTEKPTKKGFKRTGIVVEYDYENEPEVYQYEYQIYHSSDIKKTAQMLCDSGFLTKSVKRYVNYLYNPSTGELCYLALKTGLVEFVKFTEA